MKIINNRLKNDQRVGKMPPGTVVQFNKRFHQDYPPNELFIVANPGSYKEYQGYLDFPRAKVAVVSLSCGRMSFVMADRECVIMNAEVQVDGPAN
jgi:hypothetical protein